MKGSDRFAILLSTWFGCGLAGKAPGTVGSAAALLIGVLLHEWVGFAWWHYLALTAIFLYPAVWSASVTADVLRLKDPQIVVIDEVLGQWIALAGAVTITRDASLLRSATQSGTDSVTSPATLTPAVYLAAFALFRTFDIWKPWPVRKLESLPGGWGINADDLMAGVYAALVLMIAGRALQSYL